MGNSLRGKWFCRGLARRSVGDCGRKRDVSTPDHRFGKTSIKSFKAAFILIELLVVIAIIGILAALLSVLSGAKQSAARLQCVNNNLRQLALAATLYSHDFDKALAYTDSMGIQKAGDIWISPLSHDYAHIDAIRLFVLLYERT